jgi:GH15 family glucan-1,4-alpha-glucosidase
MSERLESYALLGDTEGAALVSLSGSIDWLGLPRFDSPSCLTALLGTAEDGRWSLSPRSPFQTQRRYRDGTLVLETTFTTKRGSARLVDCMSMTQGRHRVLRLVTGLRGTVEFKCLFAPKFDYGSIVPWFTVDGSQVVAIGGADALVLRTPVPVELSDGTIHAHFAIKAKERLGFALTYYRSHETAPENGDVEAAIDETAAWWAAWSSRCTYRGPHRDAVLRSLIVLKALTYAPTGAIVAAPTTSLPEALGGVRNWDYRFCWLRDATFTILALLNAGYPDEASAFSTWLLRAIAGDPSKLQIMYGVAGERRLEETELPWLPGYQNSRPVRIGNAAFAQFQLDVYGEVIDALWQAVRGGMAPHPTFWAMLRRILDYVEDHWQEPAEHGMWEIRGEPRHFTQSKVMAWVAFDRAVKAIEAGAFDGPLEKWKSLREQIKAEILERGYDAAQQTFTQYYGSSDVDASLLLLTQVGFLPPDDPRMLGTIRAIERELYDAPFVQRYPVSSVHPNVDGLPGEEGAFLACSFWFADNLALIGRRHEAVTLFEQLLALRNDVGLLSEEYDVKEKRLVGNFPQAFSHLALVNTAYNLSRYEASPAVQRSDPAAVPADLK